MTINVTFNSEQEVQRLLYLASQDHARVVGNLIIARRRIVEHETAGGVPGRIREKAEATIASAPKQEAVITGAQDALRDGLRRFREQEARKRK